MTMKHTTRGIAHWLEVAPSSLSFREVADAFEGYDSPHEAWPAGNRRLDAFTDKEASP